MGTHSAVSSLPGLEAAAAVLDLLPSGVLLVESGSARLLHANREARHLAGRDLTPARELAVRVARREAFSRESLDWSVGDREVTVLASGESVRLGDGTEVGVVTLEDVTVLEAARRRARLLADAGAQLAHSLDLGDTLAAVGRATVPAFADWCFVELLCDDGSIERALIEHRDPSRRGFIEEYDRRYPLDPDAPAGSAAVIRNGEPEHMADVTDAILAAVARDPEQLRLLRGAGFTSSIVVPLRVRGVVIGDLALALSDSGRRYEDADVGWAQELADRCAMAIDNARLHGKAREAEVAARRAGDEAQAMLGGVADAITAQEPDGRVVYANRAALDRLGYASIDALAAAPVEQLRERFEFVDEAGAPIELDRLPGRQVLMGLHPEPLLVRHRSPNSGELRWARVQATAVRDEAGQPRLAINVIEDVTDIKRAEHGYRFLADASRVLAGSLDYEATLRAVADLAVPEIADWCAVDLAVPTPEALERVAVAHVDPGRVALARDLQRRYPPQPDSVMYQVIDSGRSHVFSEITDEMLVAGAIDPEHLDAMRTLGMRSVMIVPMTVRDRVLGTISFVSAESGRRFDAQDRALAEDLALRAAVAIDNAQLYETSTAIARTLQASLLPPHLPEVPGVELAAAYYPVGAGIEVGGDFYDVFNLAEDEWYLVVGDVCGKGTEAAAITALARYTIRAAAVRRRSPAGILRWLNDAMLSSDELDGRFCTIACAHLDLSGGAARLTVACGGHPPPLLLRDGRAEEVGNPGTLLGLVADPELQDRTTDLQPGDVVVTYTDGLTDAAAPARTWSPADVAAALAATTRRDAVDIVDQVVAAALGDVPEPRDDVAVLALRIIDPDA
jgi:PAS domain S-box-containing protein